MKLVTKFAEYTMVKTDDSFTFSVKEKKEISVVKIDHISDIGATIFFREIVHFDVRACQLLAVAEDKMQEWVISEHA